jgi:hypothetical protein
MKISSRQVFNLVFTIFVIVFFGVMMFHYLKRGDFIAHIAWAREYSETGYLYKIPHTLFARFVTITRALLPANILVWISVYAKQVYDIKSYEISTLIVMILSYLATGFIIVKRLLREWAYLRVKNLHWICGGVALVIMIVAPIFIFSFPNRMFLGYASGNRFDSPTYILSKPFVLLAFLSLVDNFSAKWNWRQAFYMAFFVLCATNAKPSFTISILPTIGILIFTVFLRRLKQVNWFYLIFPIGLTSAVAIISQFIIAYVGDRGDRVLFAPFQALLTKVHDVPTLFLDWKKIKHDLSFQIASVNFLVALTYGLLLAEKANFGSINFWNSPMIAVFILFYVTVVYYFKSLIEKVKAGQKLDWKDTVLLSILAAHVICGIVYYAASLINTGAMRD